MRYLRGFFAFWYDFIVGDDWRVAAAVIVALAITAVAAHHGVTMWWFMPAVVGTGLTAAMLHASRVARRTK